MTRLGVLILVLMLMSAALVGGAMLYGRAYPQHNPLQAVGFDVCDNRWCWKGIIPGVTDWDTVKAIMLPLGGIENTDSTYTFFELDLVNFQDEHVQVAKLKDGQSVINVILQQQLPYTSDLSQRISLGDALSFYGTPCGLNGVPPSDETIVYPNVGIDIFNAGKRINVYDTIDAIEIFDTKWSSQQNRFDNCKTDLDHYYVVIQWKGLTLTSSYQSELSSSQ